MHSQRNLAQHSTHAVESKMASNKLKVQTERRLWLLEVGWAVGVPLESPEVRQRTYLG